MKSVVDTPVGPVHLYTATSQPLELLVPISSVTVNAPGTVYTSKYAAEYETWLGNPSKSNHNTGLASSHVDVPFLVALILNSPLWTDVALEMLVTLTHGIVEPLPDWLSDLCKVSVS